MYQQTGEELYEIRWKQLMAKGLERAKLDYRLRGD